MVIELQSSQTVPSDVDVIGVCFFKGLPDVEIPFDLEAFVAPGFEGEIGQTQVIRTDQSTLMALGLGEQSEVNDDVFRRVAAGFVRSVGVYKKAALVLPSAWKSGFKSATEGIVLGSYKFNEYKTKPDTRALEAMCLVGADDAQVKRGARIADAVCLARDLVNQPPGTMTPRRLADVATSIASMAGLDITVFDEIAIESERLGGLRGVSRGSDEPPRLVQLTYTPDEPEATLALVGKGITFDSGGLSLKPADGMMTMKTDMSGAAAVIATMSVLPYISSRIKVIGIVAATENLPGPKATKPGDVLRARNGKTMEVLNTDAEGRLVLADALSLAVEEGPDAIVDIATLTGACVVALGNEIAGLMGNNDALSDQIKAAADRVGEEVWPLPLPKRYRKHIDSEIADIKNIGAPKGAAGALSAGLFLKEFVSDIPWAHLDIAGPARSDSDDGYTTKGGTGFGVRTLLELVENFSKP